MKQAPTLRTLEFTQEDDSLDEDGMAIPLNPLPIKCRVCGMADLDTISEPYLLRRAAANAAGDYFVAYVGNFLIKERVKGIVEFVAPGSFDYFRTALVRGNEPSPWILAVPRHRGDSNIVRLNDEIMRCPACDEYRECNVNVVAEWKTGLTSQHDVAKVANWFSWSRKQETASPPESDTSMRHESNLAAGTDILIRKPPRRIPTRPVEFFRWGVLSVRMYALFKKLGIKGRYPCAEKADITPNAEEKLWVDAQLDRLQKAGLAPAVDAAPKEADISWFENWLRRRRKKKHPVEALEFQQESGLILPPPYIKFSEKVGTMTFRNLEDIGLDATIMARPEIHVLGSEDPELSGPLVAFADTNCGDMFCFHFGEGLSEPEIVHYNHETDCTDCYAEHFIECLRRFCTDH